MPPWAAAVAAVPLDTEPPGLPVLRPAHSLSAPRLETTTLPNGFRVVSQESFGQVTTFALFVDAGSMYEEPANELGVCHFLEATAFTSAGGRTAAEVQAYAQTAGITSQAVFNREVVMFKVRVCYHCPCPDCLRPAPAASPQVDSLRSSAPSALAMLADAALRPAFSDADLSAARQAIRAQRDDALSQPQVLVSEQMYAAAYGQDAPLGRLEKCPDDRIAAVSAQDLRGEFEADEVK